MAVHRIGHLFLCESPQLCINLRINPANSVIISFLHPTAEEKENPHWLLKIFALFQIAEDFLNVLC